MKRLILPGILVLALASGGYAQSSGAGANTLAAAADGGGPADLVRQEVRGFFADTLASVISQMFTELRTATGISTDVTDPVNQVLTVLETTLIQIVDDRITGANASG